MPYLRINYRYRGYTYTPWEDSEPDVTKIYHSVTEDLYGIEVGSIPLSPYLYAKEETFRAWIDSRMPTREQINAALGNSNICNPSEEDIVAYYIEHVLVKE